MKKVLFLIMMIASLCFLTSCDKEDKFSITSSNTVYFVSKNDEKQIKLSISGDSILEEHNANNIEYVLIDDTCEGEVVKLDGEHYFKASKLGSAVLFAKIGDLESSNKITIYAKNEQEYISGKLLETLDTAGGVVLGKEYDLGIDSSDASQYSIVGADGVLEINSDGKLEVIGIGQGKISLSRNGETITEGRYTVFNSIFATKIKEDLISQGVIGHKSDIVTNEMLDNITELDLKGEIINDENARLGVKYLRKLVTLDLSSNNLSDASFIEPLTELRNLNLSDNNFTDISSVVNNENLSNVNLSNNNLTDITKLQYLYKIRTLDLSNNNITDISPLSSSYSLEALYLNNNQIVNFKDSISGLEYLEELAVGHCGISFTDIISLKYLPNIKYLDISGSNPTIKTLANNLTKLETLILNDCSLDALNAGDSLSYLNQLSYLKELDLSNNGLDLERWVGSDGKALLDGADFVGLNKLSLGGNEFSQIPDLSNFENLKSLDLTGSYNLDSITSISNLGIEELVLDECNSLDVTNLITDINKLTKLNRLSTIGAFNYLNKSTFLELETMVSEGKISWRFLNDVWTTNTTVSNYTRSVYFSIEELLNDGATLNSETGDITLNYTGNPELILVFINDASTISSKNYSFKVPKDIMRIQVYGSKYYSYNMSFDILERKEKSFTLNLYNFSFYKNNYMSPLKAAEGSKLIVNSCLGDNKITGSNGNKPTSAIDCYDLKINVLSGSMLTVVGGNGSNGNNGTDSSSKSTRHGVDGTNGSTAIKCNSAILNTSNLTIVGGSGGNGGNGVNSGYYGGGNMDGGNGGNGGSAGSCIIYKTEVFVSPYVICETGKPGSGGSAGKQYIDAVGISWWGSPGTQGSSGRSAMAIVKNN